MLLQKNLSMVVITSGSTLKKDTFP